jgi:hypothetical protein
MIQIHAEDRFRAVAACMLLTDYVNENVGWNRPHPMRAQVLPVIEPHRDHPCALFLRGRLAAIGFGLCALSAALTPDPPFRWRDPGDAARHRPEQRYPELLTSFHEEAGLDELWRSLAAEWETVHRQCRRALDRYRVEEWMASFWGPTSKRLLLVPNPTDPPGFGFGPNNVDEAICIAGPPNVSRDAPEEQLEELFDYGRYDDTANLVIHEFGHTYLDAARREVEALAEQTADIGASLALKDWFPEVYEGWPHRLMETILRAVQGAWRAEVVSPQSAEEWLAQEAGRFGLDILPPIYRALVAVPASDRPLGPAGAVAAAAEALAGYRRRGGAAAAGAGP